MNKMTWSNNIKNKDFEGAAPLLTRELPPIFVMDLLATYGSIKDPTEENLVDNKESYKMDESVETEGRANPPLSFADLGIPTTAQLQDTMVGKARPWSDVSWKERFYIGLMVLSILGAAGFTVYRLVTIWDNTHSHRNSTTNTSNEESSNNTDFTFGLVLLLNAVFCIWFVIEGVLRERPSELVILTIATVIIMVYLIANYLAGYHNDIKLIRLIIACVFCPFLVVLGLYIAWHYHVSKQLIFRTVGASETLQKLYRNLLAFQDFLKFDLQLGGSMVILILKTPNDIAVQDIVILSVGGVFTLVWFIVGFFSMPKESKAVSIIFFLFSPAEIAYICYKMYDVSGYISTWSGLAAATIACGIVALLVRFVVIVLGVVVYKGFGMGLKEKLNPQSSRS
ncbi:uncharacterized protein LOC131942505 [Physella acuta]|uniref:uncharacterized protein LOC131942505 n=1 Tax=Physella acuta TaxID=109671 RepID=UPI0027DBD6CE|nr:uncharacterized protein LOC131942505 [Physella acuta]